MRKGFTLIELAIVLIVIGLILGFAIGGRDLVTTAKMKSDLARIDKIGSAVATYYSKFEGLPGVSMGDSSIPANKSADATSDLIGEGLLNDKDFQIELANPGNWIFEACEYDSSSYYTLDSDSTTLNYTCLGHSDGNAGDTFEQHACLVELGIDGYDTDKGGATGDARGIGKAFAFNSSDDIESTGQCLKKISSTDGDTLAVRIW